MGDVVYTSKIGVERIRGPLRKARLPATEEPVMFGVHGAIAEHYGVEGGMETTTTLDYVIAATGG